MISINSPHGYYTVGDQQYVNKTEAVFRASLTKKDLVWNFHNKVFNAIDWKCRPAGTLQDLYRERAQQIRDRYDYVVVNFSGGMDSWTVLNSFLSNGIHVDEVYTRWAFAERKYKDASNSDLDSSNLSSEFEYAVVPVLDHIKKTYPNIIIVVDDYSECIQQELAGSDFFASNHYQSMLSFFRFNRRSSFEQEQIAKNRSVGVVHGYDKIKCGISKNSFYAYFTDNLGGTWEPDRNIEFFYWTPDFPTIPVLQAHSILEFIVENLDKMKQLKLSGQVDTQHIPNYYKHIYQMVCCPDYNPNTFQVAKPKGSMVWDSDDWINQYNPRYFQSWQWTNQQFFNNIEDQYISKRYGKGVGLKKCTSPYYVVSNNIDIPEFLLPDLDSYLT
jgi:hypothetical protein